ncbi:MAG: hypothetical protein NTY96_01950 [Bacteroidetes bacterium]|nr:hypothetical protein [Bacteroidota bacterium]
MKRISIITIILIISCACNGQDTVLTSIRAFPNNSVFIEIAGNSIYFGSANYERIFINKNFFYFSGRIGIGYGQFMGNSLLSVPLLANGIFQVYHSFALEMGIGAEFLRIGSQKEYEPNKQPWNYSSGIIPTAMIGIRIQAKNGFLVRMTFAPYYFYTISESNIKSITFSPWFGLSLGGSFGIKKKLTQRI